jgi:hypothetical protein
MNRRRRLSQGHRPAFKGTQTYGWDSEPAEERPSEFGHSTGYGSISRTFGRSPRRSRARPYLLIGSLLAAFGIVVLFVMKQVLHG